MRSAPSGTSRRSGNQSSGCTASTRPVGVSNAPGAVAERDQVPHVAGAQHLVGGGHPDPQLSLGELGRGGHQRDHRGMNSAERTRDVDRADQLAGVGIVDRRGGTGPLVDPADQVLGRVDLDRLLGGERRTHAVGADLRPRTRPRLRTRRSGRPGGVTSDAPSRHRIIPWASVMIMMCDASSAIVVSVWRRTGRTARSGWFSRIASTQLVTGRSPAARPARGRPRPRATVARTRRPAGAAHLAPGLRRAPRRTAHSAGAPAPVRPRSASPGSLRAATSVCNVDATSSYVRSNRQVSDLKEDL